ncbi:MAG: hypothetical protein M3R38_05185 [Actinomycetota bacterium]|nr:hypothetical protein [Actinomycetota bacterium]
MASGSPHGIPHAEALRRGICGAQRKNEDAYCEGPRDEKGRSTCGRHCGSKNRQGYPCSQHPRNVGRCNSHGAKSLAGPESPGWVDGSSSKYGAIFSGDALEHYRVAREDDRYLELREDLAVLDTLFVEELKAARVGEGGALWEDLGRAWSRFTEADPTKDATTAGRALRRMGEIITEGVSRHAAQSHALEIHEKKRRTSETERKRIVDQERTITQVQAMSFAAGVIALLRESVAGEVNEEEILARFHAGVARLVQQYVGGSAGVLPAGI